MDWGRSKPCEKYHGIITFCYLIATNFGEDKHFPTITPLVCGVLPIVLYRYIGSPQTCQEQILKN